MKFRQLLSSISAGLIFSTLSINAFAQFYPGSIQPSTTANPKPASKVYFCGGGTQVYSGGACHFYMAGNILGKTDHSDIPGWPTPARKPNFFYDDAHLNADGSYGAYVSDIMPNQFTITNSTETASNQEELIMACPTGTTPSSATALGTAVVLAGSGTSFTTTASLSQIAVLCK